MVEFRWLACGAEHRPPLAGRAWGVWLRDGSHRSIRWPQRTWAKPAPTAALSEVNGNPWTAVAELNVLVL